MFTEPLLRLPRLPRLSPRSRLFFPVHPLQLRRTCQAWSLGELVGLSDAQAAERRNELRRIRLPEWAINFLLVFLVAISIGSLRKLYAAGQPILETIVDAIGLAAIYALLAHIFLDKEPRN
jgi:hypothetical protein